jgi:hypothetical protein
MSLHAVGNEPPEEPLVVGVPEIWAVIFNIWPDVPVYHDLNARPDRSARETVCGRAIGVYHPLLPMKHARKIGRPCRSCRAV